MSELNPARLLAVHVGAAARNRDAFAGDVLDARLGSSGLSREDRAFARVLSLGVASSWGTLDEVIDRCLRSPHDIEADVRDALRVSTYEMIFLEKAGHAAVDQGVELVRSVQPKAAGLANAVLRKISILKDEFPFGDPSSDDAALARSFAFPLWLASVLIDQMGRSAAARFMQASNTPAPVFFGVNAVKSDDASVKRAFARDGIELHQARIFEGGPAIPGCFRAPAAAAVADHAARHFFDEGKVLVSDAAAQCIAALVLPKGEPADFLEVGSGRGTKTILLQSNAQRRYGHQMNLTALDSHGFKTELLRKRAQKYGTSINETVCADARDLKDVFGTRMFDGAFIDAPCTGLGTLRRHPEIRWRLTPDQIGRAVDIGSAMLEEVAQYVRPGGRLMYATCTVLSQENEYTIKRFLDTPIGRSYRIVPCAVTPHSRLFCKTVVTVDGCDAHFAASLQRID